jgi:hypothetical protein
VTTSFSRSVLTFVTCARLDYTVLPLLYKRGIKLRFQQADVELILIPINCVLHSAADCGQ